MLSALNASLSVACDFWLMPSVHLQNGGEINTEQLRSLKGFLHIIQILLESDLLCDRCTVQTAAALGANTVGAASDNSHTRVEL